MSEWEDPPTGDLFESLTHIQLARSLLRSRACPACGQTKHLGESLCGACWRRLPASVAMGLYAQLDASYDRGMLTALRHLGAKRWHAREL